MAIDFNKNIVARNIDGNYYLVDTQNKILHRLNETGTFIFENLKKKKKPEDITFDLCEEFEVSRREAKKDFYQFIQILKKKKIIL